MKPSTSSLTRKPPAEQVAAGDGGISIEEKRQEYIIMAMLLLLVAVLFLGGLGQSAITDPAEGYYAEAAREMLETGDWITPQLNYQIYFSKPIATFWLMAASYKLLGVSEFACRLPFALIAMGTALVCYWTARALCGRAAGIAAALIFATSPLVLMVARMSPIDIAFSCFLSVAMFAAVLTLFTDSRRWWPVLYIALGCSVLTKGPAGLVLFAAGVLAFLMLRRPSWKELVQWSRRIHPWYGSLIFCAVAVPWLVMVGLATDWLFPAVFLIYENFGRALGHTNLNKAHWWFYLPVLAAGFFPWIVLLPYTLKETAVQTLSCWRSPRQTSSLSEAERSESFPMHQPDADQLRQRSGSARTLMWNHRSGHSVSVGRHREEDSRKAQSAAGTGSARDACLALFAWSIAIFLIFSASKTKLETYILPVIAPLAVLISVTWKPVVERALESCAQASRRLSRASSLLAVSGILLVVAYVVAMCMVPSLLRGFELVLAAGVVAGCAGLVWQRLDLRRGLMKRALVIAISAVFAAAAALTPACFQMAAREREDDLRALAQYARDLPVKITMFGRFRPGAMFYARRSIDTFFYPQQLQPAEDSAQRVVILTDVRDGARLQEVYGDALVELRRSGNWRLYEMPGFRLQSLMTLEEAFRTPGILWGISTGKLNCGPLTVPFAAGTRGLKQPKKALQ